MNKIVPVQQLCPESKWDIKCPYPMDPTRIVIHNTANSASAKNEITYMNNNNKKVSFHFAVDDIEVRQGLRTDRNGWHAGDGRNGKGNREGIGIEICYSTCGGEKFDKAEKLAAQFIAQLLVEYGWDITKVTKHQDYSGKYCPHRTLDLGWARFVNMVKTNLDELKGSVTPEPAAIPQSSDTYKTLVTLKGYYSSSDALKDNNPRTVVNPGTYYIFNKKGTAYNLTKTKGVPGSWVDTSLNVINDSGNKTGSKLNLNNVNLYSSSSSQRRSTTVSGEYYLWSDKVVNGKVRITRPSSNIGKVGQVTGWINAGDAVTTDSTTATNNVTKSVEEVAREVINGQWGNGQDRVNRLRAAGYNPEEVQSVVNKMIIGRPASSSISQGNKVRFKSNATTWATGVRIPGWVKRSTLYTLNDPKDGKVNVSINKSGPVTGPARVSDLYKI